MGLNVYEDLGFPDAEAMFIKAGIVTQILHAVEDRGLTALKASTLAGVDEAVFAGYLDGHFQDVSADGLILILNRLGQNVEIVVSPAKAEPAKVTVRGGREQAAA